MVEEILLLQPKSKWQVRSACKARSAGAPLTVLAFFVILLHICTTLLNNLHMMESFGEASDCQFGI